MRAQLRKTLAALRANQGGRPHKDKNVGGAIGCFAIVIFLALGSTGVLKEIGQLIADLLQRGR